MEHENPTGAEDRPESAPGHEQDRLASVLSALHELKSSISRVEAGHPALGKDLSSLCDTVISHLTRPDEERNEPPAHETAAPGVTAEPEQPCDMVTGPDEERNEPGNTAFHQADKPENSSAAESMKAENSRSVSTHGNPVTAAFDTAGGHIAAGLDKMGDGIIFAFEKLLMLDSRNRKPGGGPHERDDEV